MPTLEPTTPEPTKVPTQSPSNALGDKTCLKIQTGSNSINAGYLIVSVDTGNGYGEIASGFHAVNEQVVLEDSCFIGLLGVQVTNKNKDGWGGSITTSVNDGEYVPMICTVGCEDDGGTNTSYIFVDGNESTVGTSEASALCFNGMPDTNNVCTLNVAGGGTPTTSNPTLAPSKSPVALSNSPTASPMASPSLSPVSASAGPTSSPTSSVRIRTDEERVDRGYLIVKLDSGDGYDTILDYTPGKPYSNGTVIYEECYGTIDGIQVQGPDNNGWVGDIEFSTDGITYDPFVCEDGCTGLVKTTAPIAIDKNGNSGNDDIAKCNGGQLCTLQIPEPVPPASSSPTLSPVSASVSPTSSPVSASTGPTSSPTASPVPSQVCVRITTDEEDEPIDPNNSTNPSGYVDISLDIGDGDGYFPVSNATKEYQAGEVVLDECYQSVEVLIKVSGPSNTGWRGTIEFSTDNKAMYTPFNCADCTGDSDLAAPIAVDKNSNGGSEDIANCLDGNVCNLRQEVDPDSTPSPTSSPSLSPVSASAGPTASPTSNPTSSPVPSEVCVRIRTDEEDNSIVDGSTNPSGYVNITLNSGSGYELVSNVTKEYQAGEVVLEACYPTVEGIQVTGPDNNGWEGNIEWSIDNKQTYNPFKCLPGQCTGATNAATPIAVDLNSNGGGEDICNCLNGDLCTLVRNFTTSMPTIAPTSSPTSSPTSVSCYD